MLTAIIAFFDSYLRPLQKQALAATQTAHILKGIILLPTGVGKTLVEIAIILIELARKPQGQYGVAVMTAHRLLLCEQLIRGLAKYALKFGLPFDILTVASDGIDSEDIALLDENLKDLNKVCRVNRSTCNAEVLRQYQTSQAIGRHLLVIATYNSLDRLNGLPIDIACIDEAHTTVELDKHNNLLEILPSMHKVFFFTATMVIGCNGRGMDNTAVYGQVLCNVPPILAINSHDILPPLIMRLFLEEGKHSEESVIKAAWVKLRAQVLQESRGTLGPKMLVSVAGVGDMVELLRSSSFHTWAILNGIKVLGFSSSQGYYVSGLECTRREAIRALQGLTDEDSAIIMHYDILTEGIDLPTISGVLPLRELDTVKILQLLGRAARLSPLDRAAIYGGKSIGTSVDPQTGVVVADTTLVKPYYWVILTPQLSDNASEKDEEIVNTIRTALEIEPQVRAYQEVSTSCTTVEADSILDDQHKTPAEKKQASYTHILEAHAFRGMDPESQRDLLAELLDMMDKPVATEVANGQEEALHDSPTDTPSVEAVPDKPQERHPKNARVSPRSILSLLDD